VDPIKAFCSIILILFAQLCSAQACDEVVLTNTGQSNLNMAFDTFGKYLSGLTFNGATRLKVKVDNSINNNPSCRWNLVVLVDNGGGATPNNEWETVFSQSVSGTPPKIDILQLRIKNLCNTSQTGSQFFSVPLVTGTPIMVITNNGITTPAGSCITNVNGPGNANTNPDEYLFDIDYRIVPGGSLKSGIYELRVRFLLTEVF
jgi:hypothetical protein